MEINLFERDLSFSRPDTTPDTCAYWNLPLLLTQTQLYETNLRFVSGGHFYCDLPYTNAPYC